MILVTVWRSTLVRERACVEGLALFDRVASLQAADDPRRIKRIKVRWCPLAELWLAQAAPPGFAGWLRARKIIPRIALSEANLRGANLSEANLSEANLSRANLYGADLYGADLSEANLRGANLRGANLSRANLYGADLYGADLYGANLSRAKLRGANLSRANLCGANLSEARLSGVSRYSTDPPIAGWVVRDGVLVRDKEGE